MLTEREEQGVGIALEVRTIESRLSRLERERRALEQKIQALQRKALQSLPRRMGFESMDRLILALAEYASPTVRAHLQSMSMQAQERPMPPDDAMSGSRRKFSPELKEKIRQELRSGRKSVAALSRELGPSQQTIMNWKREWGLTRPRSRRTPA